MSAPWISAEGSDIDTVSAASKLDWSEINLSVLGTLFDRERDPDNRAQLGAHYTDRDKIMLLVEPVVIRPEVRHCRNEEDVQESGIYLTHRAKGELLGYPVTYGLR